MFWMSDEDVINCIGEGEKTFVVGPDQKDIQRNGISIYTWHGET